MKIHAVFFNLVNLLISHFSSVEPTFYFLQYRKNNLRIRTLFCNKHLGEVFLNCISFY